MTTILFDLETDGLLDEVSKVHCLCLTYPHTEGDDVLSYHDHSDLPREGTLAEGLEKLRQATVLCGHNIAGFDLPVLRKLFDFDWDARSTTPSSGLGWCTATGASGTLHSWIVTCCRGALLALTP